MPLGSSSNCAMRSPSARRHTGASRWKFSVEGSRRGARPDALAAMRAAADLEATTEKNAITPGPIVPARELLGEMLLASGDARAAYKEFEATLVTEPRRYRAVAGAMRSAKAAGDTAAAERYAAQLAQLSEHGDRVAPR